MKKIRLFFILIISALFALYANSCYAIDLNLADSLNSANSANTVTETNNNTSNNNSNANSTNNSSNTNSSATDSSNNANSNSYLDNSLAKVPQTTVTAANSSELSISDIINIFLAVIGIILILLGFAILVKNNKQ